MSIPAKEFEVNSDPILSNTANFPPISQSSFRDSIPTIASVAPSPLQTPVLPPRPNMAVQPSYGMSNAYNSFGGLGAMGSYGGMGSYGAMGGLGNYGYGGMGGYGMGNPYGGGYNRFGPNMHGDIESRFIQMAEEGSRPTFDSIQSVVSAFGSIAMMMENTFIALTSSFRAILGVAENFGRLRSLFAQFWSTFAVFRSLNWIFRKLMVLMGIRTETEFKAWAEAVAATQRGTETVEQRARTSSWPVLLFFGVIMAAPYIVLRMLKGLTNTINEKLNDPTTWQNPLRAVAQYGFQATSPQEINLSPNQVIYIAPQPLQGNLWNSGWIMGSIDLKTAGLIPVNYVKIIRPTVPMQTEQIDQTQASVNNENHMPNQSKVDIKKDISIEEMEKMYEMA